MRWPKVTLSQAMQASVIVATLAIAGVSAVYAVQGVLYQRNAELVAVGIAILRADPAKEGQIKGAREWAMDLIDANAGVHFSKAARDELMKASFPTVVASGAMVQAAPTASGTGYMTPAPPKLNGAGTVAPGMPKSVGHETATSAPPAPSSKDSPTEPPPISGVGGGLTQSQPTASGTGVVTPAPAREPK